LAAVGEFKFGGAVKAAFITTLMKADCRIQGG